MKGFEIFTVEHNIMSGYNYVIVYVKVLNIIWVINCFSDCGFFLPYYFPFFLMYFSSPIGLLGLFVEINLFSRNAYSILISNGAFYNGLGGEK